MLSLPTGLSKIKRDNYLEKRLYRIAGLQFDVSGERLLEALLQMVEFQRFEYDGVSAPLFTMEWSEEGVKSLESATKLYESECDGARSAIYSLMGEFVVRSWYLFKPGNLFLWTSGDNRVYLAGCTSSQILRFTLWLGFGLMAIRHNRIPIHSSAIVCNGSAFLFLGESGTGKSTHTRLWREHILGAELLNDDSPILAFEDGEAWVYGSPWSGKTPCFRNERYPLKALVRLSQAPYNRMERLSLLRSYGAVHPSCPPEFAYHDKLYDCISGTLSKVLAVTKVFHLECLPNREAAELSYSTLSAL